MGAGKEVSTMVGWDVLDAVRLGVAVAYCTTRSCGVVAKEGVPVVKMVEQ
jgi:hypothetical protein